MCLSAYHGNAEEEEEEKKNNVNALVAKREIDSLLLLPFRPFSTKFVRRQKLRETGSCREM